MTETYLLDDLPRKFSSEPDFTSKGFSVENMVIYSSSPLAS